MSISAKKIPITAPNSTLLLTRLEPQEYFALNLLFGFVSFFLWFPAFSQVGRVVLRRSDGSLHSFGF